MLSSLRVGLSRHWKGDSELWRAALVSVPVTQFLLMLLIHFVLTVTSDWPDPRKVIGPLLGVLVFALAIEVWAWTGLFRAGRLARQRGATWSGGLSQCVAIFGFAGLSTGTAVLAVIMSMAFMILSGGQGLKPAHMGWYDDQVLIRGDITWQTADQLELLTRDHSNMSIRVNSRGGSLGAGLLMAHFLKERGVRELIIEAECSSACTALFETTANRILVAGSVVGSHSPLFAEGLEDWMAGPIKQLRESYQRAGIGTGWIERSMATPPNTQYRPDVQELFTEGVITRVRTGAGDLGQAEWERREREIRSKPVVPALMDGVKESRS